MQWSSNYREVRDGLSDTPDQEKHISHQVYCVKVCYLSLSLLLSNSQLFLFLVIYLVLHARGVPVSLQTNKRDTMFCIVSGKKHFMAKNHSAPDQQRICLGSSNCFHKFGETQLYMMSLFAVALHFLFTGIKLVPVEEPECPARKSDLNAIKHLWDEFESHLHSRSPTRHE